MINLDLDYDKVIPPILAILSILSVLQILDSLNITIYPMIHRATVQRTFSLGFSLTPILIILVLMIYTYLITSNRINEILTLTSVSICLYFFLRNEISIAFSSLILVGWIQYSDRRIQEYSTWLLALLIVFEGLALIPWILFPFGIHSSLVWFADLELSLFYITSYLAPLLVLSLMFAWILKPFLQWILVKEGVKDD